MSNNNAGTARFLMLTLGFTAAFMHIFGVALLKWELSHSSLYAYELALGVTSQSGAESINTALNTACYVVTCLAIGAFFAWLFGVVLQVCEYALHLVSAPKMPCQRHQHKARRGVRAGRKTMKRLLLLPLVGGALLLTGCAGVSGDLECNATTSDRCMTMGQANQKARQLSGDVAGKPAAAALPALVNPPPLASVTPSANRLHCPPVRLWSSAGTPVATTAPVRSDSPALTPFVTTVRDAGVASVLPDRALRQSRSGACATFCRGDCSRLDCALGRYRRRFSPARSRVVRRERRAVADTAVNSIRTPEHGTYR